MLKKIKRNWWKLLLILVAVISLAGVFVLTRPDTYLPHKRIVLHVPYDLNDPPTSIIPMGETIYHPKPQVPSGHPGIDFQWGHPDAKILASAAGVITSIKQTPEHYNNWDIEVGSWPYVVRYKELEDYDHGLKTGSHVQAGQFLGYPENNSAKGAQAAIQIHWEFASLSTTRDRFCPMTYFDEASRQSVEAIWAKSTWQYKNQFPDVCSGDYKNKVE